MREIVLTQGDLARLRTHLLGHPASYEQLAYILAGVNISSRRLQLLCREIIPVPDGAFTVHSAAHLIVKPEFTHELYRRCRREGLSLIEAHSHPFSAGQVGFSGIDRGNEDEKFAYVERKIPDIHNATMVFGQDSVDAHVWDKVGRQVSPIDRIRVVGTPVTDWLVPVSSRFVPGFPQTSEAALSRQVLAFGEEGQKAISQCSVGVVGVGGIGSIIAEMVARLGFGRAVLVDHDKVEPSNLPRMLGTSREDVGSAKVAVLARHLQATATNTDMEVDAVEASVTSTEALQELKDVDFVFGCVDNFGARFVLNQLSIKYLLPYIDCGSSLVAQEPRRMAEVGGQVLVCLPGRFCLECVGFIDHEKASQDLMGPADRERQARLGYLAGTNAPTPSVGFLNMVVASLALGELVNLVTGFKPQARYLHYQALRGHVEEYLCDRDPECMTCGPAGLLALGDLEPWPDFCSDRIPETLPAAQASPTDHFVAAAHLLE